jgi:hypothetical protein
MPVMADRKHAMQDVRSLRSRNEEITVTLDELAREGTRRTIAAALEVEVEHVVRQRDPMMVASGWPCVTARAKRL